jgi:hypothetical protein
MAKVLVGMVKVEKSNIESRPLHGGLGYIGEVRQREDDLMQPKAKCNSLSKHVNYIHNQVQLEEV